MIIIVPSSGKNSPACEPDGQLRHPSSELTPYPFGLFPFEEFKMGYNFVKCDDV